MKKKKEEEEEEEERLFPCPERFAPLSTIAVNDANIFSSLKFLILLHCFSRMHLKNIAREIQINSTLFAPLLTAFSHASDRVIAAVN